ncbi:hypothetical protein VTK73DRAFT_869 [Phialemonium thermophilum]|uniref:Uncharacterized protein n=1 Tax=Phialemonium thermophilum TaxID=223376 RepID=A0ABR3VU53_9PEZI
MKACEYGNRRRRTRLPHVLSGRWDHLVLRSGPTPSADRQGMYSRGLWPSTSSQAGSQKERQTQSGKLDARFSDQFGCSSTLAVPLRDKQAMYGRFSGILSPHILLSDSNATGGYHRWWKGETRKQGRQCFRRPVCWSSPVQCTYPSVGRSGSEITSRTWRSSKSLSHAVVKLPGCMVQVPERRAKSGWVPTLQYAAREGLRYWSSQEVGDGTSLVRGSGRHIPRLFRRCAAKPPSH